MALRVEQGLVLVLAVQLDEPRGVLFERRRRHECIVEIGPASPLIVRSRRRMTSRPSAASKTACTLAWDSPGTE